VNRLRAELGLAPLTEDVGLADPHMPATIRALYQNWDSIRKRSKGPATDARTSRGPARLALVHAVLLLARAPKSRIVDHASAWHTHLAEEGIRQKEIPDVALDKHTLAGKRRGRGFAHFFDESSLLADVETGELLPAPTMPDPYRDKARSVLVKPRV
jgi:replication-associated recombination protein RarA